MDKVLEIIKSFIPNFENLAGLFPSISIGPNWMFGALGAVAISLFSLSLGRTRAVISLLSLYVAFFLEIIFPFSKQIQNIIGTKIESYWLDLGFFIIAYVAISCILNLSIIRKRMSSVEFSLPGIIILSILQLGFAASIVLNIVPDSIASAWVNGLSMYFIGSKALFFWSLIPLPVLLFIKK